MIPTIVLVCRLALGHVDTDVVQVALTFHRTVPPIHRVGHFELTLLLFLLLFERLCPRSRWFLNDEEYSCHALMNSSELSVKVLPGFGNGGRILLKQDAVSCAH